MGGQKPFNDRNKVKTPLDRPFVNSFLDKKELDIQNNVIVFDMVNVMFHPLVRSNRHFCLLMADNGTPNDLNSLAQMVWQQRFVSDFADRRVINVWEDVLGGDAIPKDNLAPKLVKVQRSKNECFRKFSGVP